MSGLLRDIFGNPFPPVALNSAWVVWNGGTVRCLVEAIYAERADSPTPSKPPAARTPGCWGTSAPRGRM